MSLNRDNMARVRAAAMQVFEDLGGVHGMLDWARENQTVFYQKVLPVLVKQDGSDVDRVSGAMGGLRININMDGQSRLDMVSDAVGPVIEGSVVSDMSPVPRPSDEMVHEVRSLGEVVIMVDEPGA